MSMSCVMFAKTGVILVARGSENSAGTKLTCWVHEKPFAWAFLAAKFKFRTLRLTLLDVPPNFVVLNFRDLCKAVSLK